MVRLERPTCDSALIISAARRGLRRIFRPGYGYAKAMVMLTDLSDPRKCQPHLLDMAQRQSRTRRQKAKAHGTRGQDQPSGRPWHVALRSAGRNGRHLAHEAGESFPGMDDDIHDLLKVSGEARRR